MKVTFTCEKCGKVLDSYLYDCGECYPPMKRLVDETCPVCAKLSYGPLTEEMMAEALEQASTWADEPNDFGPEARFVLRLLQEVKDWWKPIDQFKPKDTNWEYWRDWLLELARKP